MIVFEGFGAAGKGYQIGKLIHAMDPRGFYVRSVGRESEEQRRHPFLWRYWINTPARGEIAIFDRSWYRKVLLDRFDELLPRRNLSSSFDQINSFERQLTADGTVIIKLFLCIDKKEQKKRFKKLQESNATAWRVSTGDLKRNKEFDCYKEMCDEMLEHTDTSYAPWTLIESMDREFATVKIYTVVIQALQEALAYTRQPATAQPLPLSGTFTDHDITTVSETTTENTPKQDNLKADTSADDILRTSSLGKADLSRSLSKEEYRAKLKDLQSRIRQLHGEFYLRQISQCSSDLKAGMQAAKAVPSNVLRKKWIQEDIKYTLPLPRMIWKKAIIISGVSGRTCQKTDTSPSSTAPGTAESW